MSGDAATLRARRPAGAVALDQSTCKGLSGSRYGRAILERALGVAFALRQSTSPVRPSTDFLVVPLAANAAEDGLAERHWSATSPALARKQIRGKLPPLFPSIREDHSRMATTFGIRHFLYMRRSSRRRALGSSRRHLTPSTNPYNPARAPVCAQPEDPGMARRSSMRPRSLARAGPAAPSLPMFSLRDLVERRRQRGRTR